MDQRTPTWWFDPASAGTMMTSGLRSLLEGAHLTGPEMFVREATQNSVDARSTIASGPVRVRFSTYVMTPSQERTLRDFLLSDGKVQDHLEQFLGKDRFAEDGGFFLRDGRPGEETRVLLVEDFETRGLGGLIGGDGPDDHFSRLVYFFGQSHQEGSTGGAFGFGKSVYSVASAVRTVVYYSRPEGDQPSRLIAVSLFPSHSCGSRRFTGYALCGSPSLDASFPVVPIEGERADEIARGLGMERRGPRDSGTSLLVLDCPYAADDLQSALEKWWWPRLVTTGPTGLVAEAYQDGRRLSPPSPEARTDLEGFVRAYQHFLDGREDTTDTKTKTVRSTGRRTVGRLMLRRIDLPESAEEDDNWYAHTIAMVRGPKLVVQYEPLGRQHMTPFVGVFVVDEPMDPIFRRSENPAHDTWAPESSRLEDAERAYVRAAYKYCRQYAKEFQASFMARPLAPSSRLRALEDLLGRLFQRGKSPGPVPKGEERPIALSVREHRLAAKGVDEAIIEIRPRGPAEPIPARVQVTAHLLGDAHRLQIDSLHVELYGEDGQLVSQGRQAEHAFELAPSGTARYTARTRSPAESMVRFTVTVTGRPA